MLEVPTADVITGIQELWRQTKKPVDLVVVMDISGSMKGEKINAARSSMLQFVSLLDDRDRLEIVLFNIDILELTPLSELGSKRAEVIMRVSGITESGNTRLYDGIEQAYADLEARGDPDHIQAVELEYDQLAGEWWNYHGHQYSGNPDERYLNHEGGPLTVSQGKAQVVRALAGGRFGRRLLVGDGTSDMNASGAVDLFVGFGGVVRRENVAQGAPVYVSSPGLTTILPIALGPAGYRRSLGTAYAEPFERGLKHIMAGEVTFREPVRREAFLASFDPLPE